MAITRTYAVGQNSKVRRLDNHTGPWIDVSVPGNPWMINDVMADPNNPDKVVVVGQVGQQGTGIAVSTNAGVTWYAPGGDWFGTTKILYEVWYVDSSVIWTVGEGGRVYKSTDGGLTFWRTNADVVGASYTSAIHALDDMTAVVLGSSSSSISDPLCYAWKTLDGGNTWIALNGGATLLNGSMVNPIGQSGGIWMSEDRLTIIASTGYAQNKSTDGGLTFTPVGPEFIRSGLHLTWYPSHGTPTHFRHTGGPIKHIFTSLDTGTTWTDDRNNEFIYIRGAHFYSNQNGYYVAGGSTYFTSNGGVTGVISDSSTGVDLMNAVWTQKSNPVYVLHDCTGENEPIYSNSVLLQPHAGTGSVINIQGSDIDTTTCWTVDLCEQCDPTIPLIFINAVLNSYDDCDSCLPDPPDDTCYDFISCNGTCDDILGVNTVNFPDSFVPGSLYYINDDPSCVYEVYPIRQAFYRNLQSSNLSNPLGAFQLGTDDKLITVNSLIYNGVEQITTPFTYYLQPTNYQVVECSGLNCVIVPPNTSENCVDNTQIFLNQIFSTLGLPLEAYSDDPANCGFSATGGEKKDEMFRIQYRDGVTFAITLSITDNSGTQTGVLEVAPGNLTLQTSLDSGLVLEPCNSNVFCPPVLQVQVNSVTAWQGECPPLPEEPEVGEACDVTPSRARYPEPGFTWANCNPKKVVSIKCQFGDSVYALFKRMRYGIETCCEFDLDKIDIKNMMLDLEKLYDPNLCVSGEPVPYGCCPQPCNAEANIYIPTAVSCPAPTDVVVDLEVIVPPALCLEPTGVNDDGTPNVDLLVPAPPCVNCQIDVLTYVGAQLNYTDCNGIMQIEFIPSAKNVQSFQRCVLNVGSIAILGSIEYQDIFVLGDC